MDATNSATSSQCQNCRNHYVGGKVTFTYVNGYGPYCEKCMKGRTPIIIRMVQASRKDGTTT